MRARHVDQRVLEHALDAGGAIGEAPVGGLQIDRLVRVTRTPEQRDEPRRIRSGRRRLVLEVRHVERERAVRCAANQLANGIDHGGAPIRRETHDFVFGGIDFESGVVSKSGVEQPERMRKADLFVGRYLGRRRDAARRFHLGDRAGQLHADARQSSARRVFNRDVDAASE